MKNLRMIVVATLIVVTSGMILGQQESSFQYVSPKPNSIISRLRKWFRSAFRRKCTIPSLTVEMTSNSGVTIPECFLMDTTLYPTNTDDQP